MSHYKPTWNLFEQLLKCLIAVEIKHSVVSFCLSGTVVTMSCCFGWCSHEDGTVRFWDASGVSLKPLYKLSTANIFQTDCDHNDSLTQAGEEDWPPFRKVRDLSRESYKCDFTFLSHFSFGNSVDLALKVRKSILCCFPNNPPFPLLQRLVKCSLACGPLEHMWFTLDSISFSP